MQKTNASRNQISSEQRTMLSLDIKHALWAIGTLMLLPLQIWLWMAMMSIRILHFVVWGPMSEETMKGQKESRPKEKEEGKEEKTEEKEEEQQKERQKEQQKERQKEQQKEREKAQQKEQKGEKIGMERKLPRQPTMAERLGHPIEELRGREVPERAPSYVPVDRRASLHEVPVRGVAVPRVEERRGAYVPLEKLIQREVYDTLSPTTRLTLAEMLGVQEEIVPLRQAEAPMPTSAVECQLCLEEEREEQARINTLRLDTFVPIIVEQREKLPEKKREYRVGEEERKEKESFKEEIKIESKKTKEEKKPREKGAKPKKEEKRYGEGKEAKAKEKPIFIPTEEPKHEEEKRKEAKPIFIPTEEPKLKEEKPEEKKSQEEQKQKERKAKEKKPISIPIEEAKQEKEKPEEQKQKAKKTKGKKSIPSEEPKRETEMPEEQKPIFIPTEEQKPETPKPEEKKSVFIPTTEDQARSREPQPTVAAL